MYKIGDLINERYQLQKLILKTKMSSTYIAQDLKNERERVLFKELFLESEENEFTKTKKQNLFYREAEVLSKLQNPGIPALIEKKSNYLVEEFIEGETLTKKIDKHAEQEENSSKTIKKANFINEETDVIILMQKILQILEYVHSKSYIHRDVKPSNLMLSETNKVYLIDFGAVGLKNQDTKDTDGLENEINQIGSPTIIGTPGYAPNEQFFGRRPRPSFDIYAVGMIGIEMITNKKPESLPRGQNNKLWGRIWENSNIAISDTFREVLEKMADDIASKRYKSVQEVSNDLVSVFLNLFDNKSQPLQGEDLQTVLDWIQDKKDLKKEEFDFLIKSIVWEVWGNNISDQQKNDAAEIINNNWSFLEEKVSNSYSVIREILEWSKPSPSFVQKLCQLVYRSDVSMSIGDEAVIIEKLLDNHISSEEPAIKAISDSILDKDRGTGKLLSLYEKILNNEEVIANENFEQRNLIASGLVFIDHQGKLRIYKIYEKIFNNDWIKKEILNFRNKNIEVTKIPSHESNSPDLKYSDNSIKATPIQGALSRIGCFIAIPILLGIAITKIIDNFKVSQPSPEDRNSSNYILPDKECGYLSNKIVIAQAEKIEQVNTIKEIRLLIESEGNSLSTLCNEDIEKRFNKLLYDHAWILINGNNYVTNEKEEYDAIEILCMITENHQNFSDVTRHLQEWHSTDIEKSIVSDTRQDMRSKIKELHSQDSCPAAKLN